MDITWTLKIMLIRWNVTQRWR